MRLREFDKAMRSELRALTNVAEDMEDLADGEESYRMQQEMLGKAARVYDSIYGIRSALDKLTLGGGFDVD